MEKKQPKSTRSDNTQGSQIWATAVVGVMGAGKQHPSWKFCHGLACRERPGEQKHKPCLLIGNCHRIPPQALSHPLIPNTFTTTTGGRWSRLEYHLQFTEVKPKIREVKQLAQGHTARQGANLELTLHLPTLDPVLMAFLIFLPSSLSSQKSELFE